MTRSSVGHEGGLRRLARFLGAAGALALLAGSASCASSVVTIPLVRTAGLPLVATPASTIPLEVVTHSTAVSDPLPVRATNVAYADLEHTLGFAVSSGVAPWAASRVNPPKDGWQLFVDLTQARAEYVDGRLFVSLTVQATLRTRAGNAYVGQTTASCRQAGLVAPQDGAPIFYACMTHIGRDLDGWLGGLVAS
jgi:hypothetical protein